MLWKPVGPFQQHKSHHKAQTFIHSAISFAGSPLWKRQSSLGIHNNKNHSVIYQMSKNKLYSSAPPLSEVIK
jgi:hypothetical protein